MFVIKLSILVAIAIMVFVGQILRQTTIRILPTHWRIKILKPIYKSQTKSLPTMRQQIICEITSLMSPNWMTKLSKINKPPPQTTKHGTDHNLKIFMVTNLTQRKPQWQVLISNLYRYQDDHPGCACGSPKNLPNSLLFVLKSSFYDS